MSGEVGRSALLVASLTVVARGVGLVRQLVFQATVGVTLLGTVYATANSLPNVLFEVVAGGALAAAVVPLVSAGLARSDLVAARDAAGARACVCGLDPVPRRRGVMSLKSPHVSLMPDYVFFPPVLP